MESTDADLTFAIDIAKTDRREAPWYGVWNIILTQKLFNGFCKQPCSTITYPQFPLTRDVDTYETEIDGDWSDEEIEEEDIRFPGGDSGPLTPSRPVPRPFQAPRNARRTPTIRESDAPSPDAARVSLSFLPATPLGTPVTAPAIPTPTNSNSDTSSRARRGLPLGSPGATSSILSSAPASALSSALSSAPASALSSRLSNSPSALHLLSPKKSTRIPDFVQLIVRPSDKVFERMIILLVEIKKRYPHTIPSFVNLTSLTEQAHAQAYHAFSADLTIHTVGIILALGDAWTYQEYDRQSAWTDFTFQTPDHEHTSKGQRPTAQNPIVRTYPTIEAHFTDGYAILTTPESDLAFAALRKRMNDLNRWK